MTLSGCVTIDDESEPGSWLKAMLFPPFVPASLSGDARTRVSGTATTVAQTLPAIAPSHGGNNA